MDLRPYNPSPATVAYPSLFLESSIFQIVSIQALYQVINVQQGGRASIAWNSTYDERLTAVVNLTRSTELAEEITGPDGGAYVHESNMFTTKFRESYWGTNYDRLLEIKDKYDPDTLLNCWKCVGFREERVSSVGFQCQGRLQMDLDSA